MKYRPGALPEIIEPLGIRLRPDTRANFAGRVIAQRPRGGDLAQQSGAGDDLADIVLGR